MTCGFAPPPCGASLPHAVAWVSRISSVTPSDHLHIAGPTSASPGHYPRRLLLRASSSPAASGWPLLCGQRAAGESSRTQARATLGREFPISALSMAKRVPRPAIVHVSCVLSKIPYGGFSPVRLPAEGSCNQPDPSRPSHRLKRQVRIPQCDRRFAHAFVVVAPSCRHGGYSQRHQPQARLDDHLSPRVLCSRRFLLSPHHCSYDPIRQSRRLPRTSQEPWLYRGSVPDDLVWAASETFPALGQRSCHTCHPPYAGRRSECIFPVLPHPQGLPQRNNGSAPPSIPTPVSVGGNSRRCSVRLMLRPAWLLAFLDWSDLTKPVGRRRRVRPSLP